MYKLEAKKSLGQNFLHNKTIIGRIAEAGQIEEGEVILEIGPGTGELTAGIIEKIEGLGEQLGGNSSKKSKKGLKTRLISIEKDHRAIPILLERFKKEIKEGILEVIEGDFLEIDIETLISGRDFKIIANIPYYITGAIIRKSLELSHKPKKLIFLVQKEVAERIVQRDGKGSILSNSIAFYGVPKLLFPVAKGNFVPAPKVDSAVISVTITENSKNLEKSTKLTQKSEKTTQKDEKRFFDLLHAGFAHKRKILSSNIKEFLAENDISQTATEIFESIGLNPKIRAEELKIDDWILLAKTIFKKK